MTFRSCVITFKRISQSTANCKGFISIYALLIMSVFILLASLLATKTATFAYVYKQQKMNNYIDIHIAQYVIFHYLNEKTQGDNSSLDDKEAMHDENNDSQESETKEETFKNIEISYSKIAEGILAKYENHKIIITIDWENKNIMNYVYNQ